MLRVVRRRGAQADRRRPSGRPGTACRARAGRAGAGGRRTRGSRDRQGPVLAEDRQRRRATSAAAGRAGASAPVPRRAAGQSCASPAQSGRRDASGRANLRAYGVSVRARVLRVGQLAAIRPVEQVGPERADILAVQGAAVGTVTPGDELVEGVLRASTAWVSRNPRVSQAVVDDALQHHRPGPGRGNNSAYCWPSRVPYELPWKVSCRSPSAARRASRSRTVLQRVRVVVDRSGTRPAVGPQPPVVRHVASKCGLAVRIGGGCLPAARGRADHRAAAADAARVEADDVEPALQLGAEPADAGGHPLHAGVARTAGPEHQRADPGPGVLATRASKRTGSNVGPFGWLQSTGTRRVAHSDPAASGSPRSQSVQARWSLRTVCCGSAPGRGVRRRTARSRPAPPRRRRFF